MPEPESTTAAGVETGFWDRAPLTSAPAATVILDWVRSGLGESSSVRTPKALDAAIRARSEAAYNYTKLTVAAAKTTVEARASWAARIRSWLPS